ncbi:MAG: hypothetical protein WB819_08320 [Terriglobia bacterium]|jgi:hypothetical protein
MWVGDRQVLKIEDLPLVVEALNTLSADVQHQGGESLRTLTRLQEFVQEGCGRLVLNLNAIEGPLSGPPDGPPQEVRNVEASLVAGVLVVTCQVTSRELLRIKLLARRQTFPKHLISSFDALFSSTAARIRNALSRMGRPKAN